MLMTALEIASGNCHKDRGYDKAGRNHDGVNSSVTEERRNEQSACPKEIEPQR